MFPEISFRAILTIEYLASKLNVPFGYFLHRLEQIVAAPGTIPFQRGMRGKEILSEWFGGRLPPGSADMIQELIKEMDYAYRPLLEKRLAKVRARAIAKRSSEKKVFDRMQLSLDKLKDAWASSGMKTPSGKHVDGPTLFSVDFINKNDTVNCSMIITYGFRNGYPATTGSEVFFHIHETWLGRVALRKMANIENVIVLDLMLSGETDDFEIYYGTIVEQHRGFALDVHEAAIVRHKQTKISSYALSFSDAKDKLIKKLVKAKLVPRNKYRQQ